MNDAPQSSWVPTIVHSEPDYALAYCGPLFAVIWRRETTVAGAAHLKRAYHEYAKAGQPYGLITIIEADAPLPESDARDAVAEFLNGISETCVVSSVIFEGAGFRSAAVRAVVTGLTMLARQAYPHRVFGSVDEAAPWYVERAPAEWQLTEERYRSSVQRMRDQITD